MRKCAFKDCRNMIRDADEICDACCRMLDAVLEATYLEAVFAGDLVGAANVRSWLEGHAPEYPERQL